MSAPKYAKKVDLNQADIVAALRNIPHCQVEIIGQPVDLLVGITRPDGCYNLLLEVKRPGEKPRTKKQRLFIAQWPGQIRVVQTPEEAVELVMNCYRSHYEPTDR